GREQRDLLRWQVPRACNWVVVHYGRKGRRLGHRRDVRLDLPGITQIHVRRKDHQTRTAGTLRLPSQRDTLRRREPRDPRDHGHTVRDRLAARAEDPDLLLPRQRRRLAQRTQGDEALAAMIDQPGRMLLEEAVIDRSIATERSRDRREDPGPVAPVHEDPPKGVSNSAPRTGRRETPAQRRARL